MDGRLSCWSTTARLCADRVTCQVPQVTEGDIVAQELRAVEVAPLRKVRQVGLVEQISMPVKGADACES